MSLKRFEQGVIGGGDLHERIATEIPQLARGMVWCKKCGASLRVDSANALRNGWPKCCGETMTIDSPEERKRFTGATAVAVC